MRRFRDSTPDVFDISRTGMVGYWQDLLDGDDLEYYHNKKNLKGTIVQMSPNEYYREAAKVLNIVHGKQNISSSSLMKSRNADPNYIKELEEVITVKHEKFPIPVLDVSTYHRGQEGLHRMMVVGNLYGWDTKFPVLLVEDYKKINPEEVLKNIVKNAQFTYYDDYWDLERALTDDLQRSIFYKDFNVEYLDWENKEEEIEVYGLYEGKEYYVYEKISKFDIRN